MPALAKPRHCDPSIEPKSIFFTTQQFRENRNFWWNIQWENSSTMPVNTLFPVYLKTLNYYFDKLTFVQEICRKCKQMKDYKFRTLSLPNWIVVRPTSAYTFAIYVCYIRIVLWRIDFQAIHVDVLNVVVGGDGGVVVDDDAIVQMLKQISWG